MDIKGIKQHEIIFKVKKFSPPELVEKKSIGNNNTEKNSNQVQKLAEAEVHVVAGKSGAEVKEVAGDGGRVTVLKQKSLLI